MKSACLALAVLLLCACSGGLRSDLPVAQVYVLRPAWPAGAPGTPAGAGTVQVAWPIAAPGLSSDSIMLLRAGERLDYYSGARWAAAAPAMLQALTVEALRAAHKFAMVESDSGPFGSEYMLSLELTHFEAEYTGAGPPSVHVALVGTLGKRGSRDVIASFTADSRVSADADHMQSVVAAFERATGEALAQIAANISVPETARP
jgi:cholesterol transport system auxiliary component